MGNKNSKKLKIFILLNSPPLFCEKGANGKKNPNLSKEVIRKALFGWHMWMDRGQKILELFLKKEIGIKRGGKSETRESRLRPNIGGGVPLLSA